MPGAYAHMTLANVLNRPDNKNSIPSLSKDNKRDLGDYLRFCELGAVSPDYPYLAIGDSKARTWSDRMHYEHTGQMIHSGIRLLSRWTGEPRNKAFVWLLGYASHVVADVTIHPVIEMKVGEYEKNKREHRVCEMNQDAYIYSRRLKLQIDVAQHLATGIGLCGDGENQDNLDSDIRTLWLDMLKEVYPDDFASSPPEPNDWHKGFKRAIGLASAASGMLIHIARHVAVDVAGLAYPDVADVDRHFIVELDTPLGTKNYDEIFDAALENSNFIWDLIARGVFHDDEAEMAKIADWNLDTGRDQNGRLGFWS
jgi:hypothetical protein